MPRKDVKRTLTDARCVGRSHSGGPRRDRFHRQPMGGLDGGWPRMLAHIAVRCVNIGQGGMQALRPAEQRTSGQKDETIDQARGGSTWRPSTTKTSLHE